VTNIAERLGVQGYCYRGFKKTADLIAKVKETGLSRLEVWNGHVDFGDEAAGDEFLAKCKAGGVEVAAIGVMSFTNDAASERKCLRFARKAGAPYVSCDFAIDKMPDALRTAERLADELDVKLMIHNHGGGHWLGSSQALAWLLAQASPRVGLCLDTAWAMHSHEDPVAMAERFADRLYGLHIKDFTFDRAGNHKDVVVGTGNLDLERLDRALKKVGFAGCAILEYEGDVDNPVPALAKCVANIRKHMR